MERYWCLRWLVQAQATTVTATVLRENLVRLESVPLVLRVNSLPSLDRGARVELDITRIDLLDADIHANYRSTLAEHGEVGDEETEDEAGLIGVDEVSEGGATASTAGAEAVATELGKEAPSASALGAPAGAE
jgi:hypothetical protein